MSRKGESIFKRKDGRWEGRYIKERSPQGKAIYGYVYGSTYGKTKDKLRQRASGIGVSSPPRAAQESLTTIGGLAESWLYHRRASVKESTYIKYRNLVLSYIQPQLGDTEMSDLTPESLQEYYHWLTTRAGRKGEGLSAKTSADVFTIIRSILRSAAAQKLSVGCTGAEVSVRSCHHELSILSAAQQDRLVSYLVTHPSMSGLGILLCLYTGIRLGEICALKWEDVSEHEKTIYIHRTMQRLQQPGCKEKKTAIVVSEPKSHSSKRVIPIPPVLQPILDAARTEEGYVLTGEETYMEPRTMENHFKRVLKNAGIEDTNFHCLRHTFATRCVEVGFDVKTLSEILGHANTSITMNRYVHPTIQMKRENMERLSSLFLVSPCSQKPEKL